MHRKQQHTLLLVCVAYGLWQTSSQWMSTLMSFLQWDTRPPMDVTQISYVQAMGSFCNALGAFMLGQFIDISGSKSMFMLSVLLTAAYYAALSQSGSFVAFLVSQLFRIGYHFEAGAEMYLATVTTERERTSAMMVGMSVPHAIALMIGPLLASKVAAWFGLRAAAMACAAFLAFTLTPLIMRVLPDTHDVPRLASARLQPFDGGVPMLLRNAALCEAILLRVLVVAPFICYELVGRQFIMRRYFSSPSDLALLLLITGSSMMFVQFGVLRQCRQALTPRRTMQSAFVMLALSYMAILYSRSFHQMLLVSAVQSAAYALAFAETSTQITSAVDSTQLGKATGLASTTQWLLHCVMPLLTAQLAMYWHYTYVIYLAVLLSSVAFMLVTFACTHVDQRIQDILPVLALTS